MKSMCIIFGNLKVTVLKTLRVTNGWRKKRNNTENTNIERNFQRKGPYQLTRRRSPKRSRRKMISSENKLGCVCVKSLMI
jgi:hypothetical protein